MRIDDHVIHFGKGKKRKTKCRYCHSTIASQSKTRWASHLRNCGDLPPQFRMSIDGFAAPDDPTISTGESEISAISPSKAPEPLPKRIRSARGWFDRLDQHETEVLNAMYVDVFYHNGIPFNIADNSSLVKFLQRLRPAWKPPSRKQIAGPLLDAAFAVQEAERYALVKSEPKVAIVTDGWSNIRNDHLVNYVVVFPSSTKPPMLVKSVVTGETQQTAAKIARGIEETMEQIGIERVAGIVTDNASNMQGAWTILEGRYPGLICNGCVAHTFNLLVKDVCLRDDVKATLDECREVVNFVKQRTAVLTRFVTIQDELKKDGTTKHARKLILPADTRWYTHHGCLCRVHENKLALRQLAAHPVMDMISGKSKVKRDEFVRLVQDSRFWQRVEVIERVLKPTSSQILSAS